MTEEGTLSILMLENTYKVQYASNNPHSQELRPYQCPDEAQLGALLHDLTLDSWYVQQAFAELYRGGFAALPVAVAPAQLQEYFSTPTA